MSSPTSSTVQRTFVNESVRSVAAGIQETALLTFAILIAVKQFDSSALVKSTILASQALGLIGSLFLVPWMRQLGLRPKFVAAGLCLVSAVGFAIAAISQIPRPDFSSACHSDFSRWFYHCRSTPRFCAKTIPMKNAAASSGPACLSAPFRPWFSVFHGPVARGRFWKFPVGARLLRGSRSHFRDLFGEPTRKHSQQKLKNRRSVFESMHWLRDDRIFRIVIISAMFMGLGVLPINALRVDYLAKPSHGVGFDVATVTFLSGVVPSVMRVVSSFFWGWLFDRMNFIRLRIVINLFFIAGILAYFTTPIYGLILIGAAIFGIARGGGEILWNLWVNKLAKPEHVAEYMSVHTFCTGLRALIAPFLGFYVADLFSIKAVVIFSTVMVGIAVATLRPFWQVALRGEKN